MANAVLLSGVFSHGLVLFSGHLELHILILSDIRDLDLLAESFEHPIVGRADGLDKFRNLGFRLLRCLGLLCMIRGEFLQRTLGVFELIPQSSQSQSSSILKSAMS